MLGRPFIFLTPEVVGVPHEQPIARRRYRTDLVLHITQLLRAKKSSANLSSLRRRRSIAPVLTRHDRKQSPEYGARTVGFSQLTRNR